LGWCRCQHFVEAFQAMTELEDQLEVGRKRVEQVFRYLEALNQHRNPARRRIDEQLWHTWLCDLPDHPSIRIGTFAASSWDESEGAQTTSEPRDDFILRVRRPKLTKCPPPPSSLLEWLERGWEEPSARVRVRQSQNDMEGGQGVIVSFGQDPARPEDLNAWLQKRQTWATNELPARAAMAVFERLYEIRGQVEREGENVELVLGDGTLTWRQPAGSIFHPILLQRLHLEFDPTLPEFSLIEAESPVELYSALFQSMPEVEGKTIAKIRLELENGKYHPLGKEDTSGFLRRVAVQLSPHGEFRPEGVARTAEDNPIVGRSSVVFLRRRNLGFAVSLQGIRNAIAAGGEIPRSLLRVVGIETHEIENTEQEVPRGWLEDIQPAEVLLSKPANPEQIRIAEGLDAHGSVLVQGPPGTGKTHTIANLIGHLLAQGKSVLVTSHATKALRVLRDHVVEDLQPLCVSVLDSDLESRKQLESSVDAIVTKLSLGDVVQMERQAADVDAKRRQLIDQYRKLATKLLNARCDEFRSIAGTDIPPSQAARLVARHDGQLSFLPSPVDLGAVLPLSDSELHELYATNRLVSREDEVELGGPLPALKELPPAGEFVDLLSQRAMLRESNLAVREDLWASSSQDIASLQVLITRADKVITQIRSAQPWQTAAMLARHDGPDEAKPWESTLRLIEEAWDFKTSSLELLLTHDPKLPDDWHYEELQNVAEEIWFHTQNGGGLSFVTLMTRSSWKRFLSQARVVSGEPKRAEHFEALYRASQLNSLRSRLVSRWAKQMAPLGAATVELDTEPEVVCRQVGEMLRRCLDWHATEWQPLEAGIQDCGFNLKRLIDEQPPCLKPGGQLLRIADTLDGPFREAVVSRISKLTLTAIDQRLLQTEELLSVLVADEQVTRVVTRLRNAIAAGDPDLYREAHLRLQDLYHRRKHLMRRHELLDKLRPVAPGWASAIASRVDIHGTPEMPKDIREAWYWRQMSDELDKRARTSLSDLQDQLARVDEEIRACTAQLIEQKAWASQLRRAERSLHQKQALIGWLDTQKKMGKGTGIRVPKLKAEANRLMSQCRGAVPVWIMPLSRVADNFEPKTTRFDVVIIDEASQSDVMSLSALYLAEKAIVVGDHEQVSPSAVGQELGTVQHLIDEFLDGVPNAHLYDGQTSIYDLARQSFGGTIRLLEHFRCVPEIIQFSNHLSYEGKIRPLRDASSVTLKPHVVARRVPNGQSEGKRNEVEAKEIASLIIAATEQEEYDGKTFGVISLVGDEQAYLIDSILRQHLSEEEFKLEHNILCGNASQFQGDERDVVFLSVIDSSVGAVLRLREEQMFKQRFNVAASRARDQMWVIHSLDPRSHLKPGDLRRRLIEYAEDPAKFLKTLDSLEARVESEFELEVAASLVRLGFRVIPQWRVGYYRIDLVVEGNDKRLAVECDGDRYHSIEKLPDDMARQAVLERLGWTFVRLRGSQFFRDPAKTLEPLLHRLRSLGIEPSLETATQASEKDQGELLERVLRRAQEVRLEWEISTESASMDREKPDLVTVTVESTRSDGEVSRIPVKAFASESDADSTDGSDEQSSLVGEMKLSRDIPAEEVRAAIYTVVPTSGRIDRGDLIRRSAQGLGFVRVSKLLRSRINKTISAEVRYGRLCKDSEWNYVWRNPSGRLFE
jgi:very-short-patch-repair endonuclease/DNA polymerase III delta prime subunit